MAERTLPTVPDVEKPILFVSMPLVQFPHQGPRRRQRIPHKQEQALIAREGDALSNDVGKLAEGQVARDEKLVLVNERDRLGGLGATSFDNDGDSARELFVDSAAFLGPGRQRVGALKVHSLLCVSFSLCVHGSYAESLASDPSPLRIVSTV